MIKKLCWYNQRWNVYLKSEGGYSKWGAPIETKTIEDNGGVYRLTKYNVEGLDIFTYGYLTKDLKQRPGHGGEWSSSCQQINSVFNTNLTEIGLDQIACSIDIDVLRGLLGPEYVINEARFGMDVLSADGTKFYDHMTWRELK